MARAVRRTTARPKGPAEARMRATRSDRAGRPPRKSSETGERPATRSEKRATRRVGAAKPSRNGRGMESAKISDYTVRRLSVYCHILEELELDGNEVVSSARLAKLAGTNSAQVRKDLSYFGNFGKRGRGYSVSDLKRRIRSILGIDRHWRVVLVGAGNLGSALFSYKDFANHGFKIVAILDNDPEKVGTRWDGIEIVSVDRCEEVLRGARVDVAVVTTPASEAQVVVDRLVRAGVRGVLNFAPCKVEAPGGIHLRNVNITIELEGLSFALRAEDPASRG
ncbi:MAG: redox-sensing transcriptional repressor Rex [Candidatus Eisenbacteria bacterium]